MFQDLIAFLVATFLVGPLQSELNTRLAQAPQQVVQDMAACATAATPALVQRAAGDPWWAVSTAVSAWIGQVQPEAVLRDAAPPCGPAFAAARPFLARS